MKREDMSRTFAMLSAPGRVNYIKVIAFKSVLNHPYLWIASLADAVKTSLVANYLQTKNVDIIWYQLDEGD